jgi:hypothetical protein
MIQNKHIFNFPKVKQPSEYVNLFDHQLTAIYEMEKLEKEKKIKLDDNSILNTNIGVYSDPTGYGKTLSVIGLILRDNMECEENSEYINSNVRNFCDKECPSIQLSITQTQVKCQLDKTIILVNNSIITQWTEAFDLFKMKYYVIDSKKKIDKFMDTKLKIILITPTMYNKFMYYTEFNKYNKYIWKRFVFDEPTNTRIPNMVDINTCFTWLITATPDSLRYNGHKRSHYILSIFNQYLNINILKSITIANDLDYVKQSYKIPKTNYIKHTCYQPTYHMVKNYIDSDTSNMISAGNILGAIRKLGGNETSNIYELIKSKIQDDIDTNKLKYDQYVRRNNQYYISHYKERVEALEKKMKNLTNDFEDRLKGDCNICIDKINKPILMPCCQNIFCGGCILEWLKGHSTCPLCRSDTDISNIVYIKTEGDKNNTPEIKQEKKLTKLETIVEIITNNYSGKFIVFSNWNESFPNIRSILYANEISYKELGGHISTRNKNIKAFKEGKIKVLFLNSMSNGAGINLQEATDIIMFHSMEEDLETQIIGRANRIGRKGELFVHYLV